MPTNEISGYYDPIIAPTGDGPDDRTIHGVAAASQRQGSLELAARTLVAGWAFAGVEAGRVALAIVVNGAVVARITADRFRPDLKAAGIGDGCHAFFFRLPNGLSADVSHTIEVRREIDWTLLPGAPVTLWPSKAAE